MDVAIMQPYFFPYIGYFQLMKSVQRFVFYDDAQFMKGGWVNRNRILYEGQPRWWTYPVVHDDYRLPISGRRYRRSHENDQSLLGKLDGAYRNAPHHADIRGLVQDSLPADEDVVSSLNQHQLTVLSRRLGITCEFHRSSDLAVDDALTAEQRVIAICRQLGATRYINSAGGMSLYQRASFEAAGIELAFLQPRPRPYAQLGQAYVPSLSIVDVLMFNPVDAARAMLDDHDLAQSRQ
jgi:hypothetical protein